MGRPMPLGLPFSHSAYHSPDACCSLWGACGVGVSWLQGLARLHPQVPNPEPCRHPGAPCRPGGLWALPHRDVDAQGRRGWLIQTPIQTISLHPVATQARQAVLEGFGRSLLECCEGPLRECQNPHWEGHYPAGPCSHGGPLPHGGAHAHSACAERGGELVGHGSGGGGCGGARAHGLGAAQAAPACGEGGQAPLAPPTSGP